MFNNIEHCARSFKVVVDIVAGPFVHTQLTKGRSLGINDEHKRRKHLPFLAGGCDCDGLQSVFRSNGHVLASSDWLAIEQSKDIRPEIAKRDDIKLIFIAEERTAEGSEAYHNYVKEWLADEETICVGKTDFTRMQELFRFNGIPHYETITPEGRRVRDDLRITGYFAFDYELNRLKEQLKD